MGEHDRPVRLVAGARLHCLPKRLDPAVQRRAVCGAVELKAQRAGQTEQADVPVRIAVGGTIDRLGAQINCPVECGRVAGALVAVAPCFAQFCLPSRPLAVIRGNCRESLLAQVGHLTWIDHVIGVLAYLDQ